MPPLNNASPGIDIINTQGGGRQHPRVSPALILSASINVG